MNALPWTIAISFAAAGLLMVLPRNTAGAARVVALLAALAGLAAAIGGTAALPGYGLNTLVHVPWLPQVGATFHLAADGITAVLTILTGLAATAGILFSWNVDRRPREFFALYLALIGGVYGVFLSADVLLLFVFYEIAIVPKYFLIALWGSTNREYGAMKLALYSFVGSALILVGMLAAYAASGGAGFGLHELAGVEFSRGFQLWAFPLVAFGFAVLAGLWPFHTWAPTGHVAAPTAASMLLAGVVMKLGAYGVLRVAVPLFPEGFHAWSGVFAGLAVIGIVYAGFVALVQKDLKFVIGYSSVSHMGFVILGIAAATPKAVAGSVLQMFSHGVIAGLLFAVVGRMVYDRTHTRELSALTTMGLNRAMPFAAVTFVIAGLASMGMPGFSGFPAELSILVGAWATRPLLVLVAAAGIVLAASFTLRAVYVTFYPSGATTVPDHPLEPITLAEKCGAALLIAATIVVGLHPDLLLDMILPALNDPLMARMFEGGAP